MPLKFFRRLLTSDLLSEAIDDDNSSNELDDDIAYFPVRPMLLLQCVFSSVFFESGLTSISKTGEFFCFSGKFVNNSQARQDMIC